jgi:hypothetical protein
VLAAQPPRMSLPTSATPHEPASLQASAQAPSNSGNAAMRLSPQGEQILCNHCGRTATNGISCEGYCVADSGY